MTTRWARFARGWAIAGFSTFIAALSHTLGGGHAPGVVGVVLALAFAGVVCVGLSGRRLSLARVGASVALSQLIFHGLFSLGSASGALAPASALRSGAHGHGATQLLSVASDSAPIVSAHGPFMWSAHAVAAVITIVAVRHGQSCFRRILNQARLAVRSLFAPTFEAAPAPLTRVLPLVTHEVSPRILALFVLSMGRRGPPVLVSHVA